MTRIVVNQYYMHENNLVKVVGAAGMDNPDTTRFLIQWGDSQGRACSAEVTRRELSPAPTIERLYQDYRQCLEAICNQANRIEELENAPSLFQQVMTASKDYVERFGGTLNSRGAEDKAAEEFEEFKEQCDCVAFHLTFKQPHSEAHKQLIEGNRRDAAEELIDCLVTLGGMAACAGLTWDDIQTAARAKLDKLNQRTTDTHAWNGTTVERIGKAQS